jgi:N,N'-diacetyllegionaminate synthase
VNPVIIIAEAGVNHNGDMNLAHALIDAAVDAGADIVKFQTFRADALATRDAPKAAYQIETTGAAESQFNMLRRLELAPEDHQALLDHCRSRKIEFLSTPFDEISADLLSQLGVTRLKIPSGEVTNLPFLAHVARLGRPLILSTGMADLDEVAEAVACVKANGNPDLSLLHCVTNYPADPADCNLAAMATMAQAFKLPVGWSDHTLGNEISLAAVALGAAIIEKHLTLDRTMEGPDHRASSEPTEFAALVAGIRMIERSIGDGVKRPAASEQAMRSIVRKSIFAKHAIPAGHIISATDLIFRRPGSGISPARLPEIIGRQAKQAIDGGSPLDWSFLD